MTIQDIALKSIEGFHVGGERVYMDGFPEQLMTKVPGAAPIRVSMNGHHMVGQMYCQRYTQSNPRSPLSTGFSAWRRPDRRLLGKHTGWPAGVVDFFSEGPIRRLLVRCV